MTPAPSASGARSIAPRRLDYVERVVASVSLDGPIACKFSVRLSEGIDGYQIMAVASVPDVVDRRPNVVAHVHHIADVPYHTCRDAIIRTLRGLAQRVYLHELAEWWTVDGERPEDPHKDEHR